MLSLAFDVVGWSGAFVVLMAYIADNNSLHFLGSLMLAGYSAVYRMWPQVATNALWMIFAAKKKINEPRAGVEPTISTLEG